MVLQTVVEVVLFSRQELSSPSSELMTVQFVQSIADVPATARHSLQAMTTTTIPYIVLLYPFSIECIFNYNGIRTYTSSMQAVFIIGYVYTLNC